MKIEGTVVNVMESWPLQLTVQTRAERYQVALSDATTIMRAGQSVDPRELRPNRRVEIQGESSGTGGAAMIAHAIEIFQ